MSLVASQTFGGAFLWLSHDSGRLASATTEPACATTRVGTLDLKMQVSAGHRIRVGAALIRCDGSKEGPGDGAISDGAKKCRVQSSCSCSSAASQALYDSPGRYPLRHKLSDFLACFKLCNLCKLFRRCLSGPATACVWTILTYSYRSVISSAIHLPFRNPTLNKFRPEFTRGSTPLRSVST